MPDETARIARAAFQRGNVYLRLRDDLGTINADEAFASLFPTQGQPAEAPWRLALVTVQQFAEGLSDRQAAAERLDWKHLLGLELHDAGLRGRFCGGSRSDTPTGQQLARRGGQPSPRLGAQLAGRLWDRALLGFGDFLGCREFPGCDGKSIGQCSHGARRGFYAAGFEARNGDGVQVRLARQFGLREEPCQA